MPTAYIQLVANWSSPRICIARATGCRRTLLIFWAISSNEAPKLLVVAWRKGGTHNFSTSFFISIINQHPDSHRLDILIILIIKLTRSCDFLGSRSPYLHCTWALSDVSHVGSTIQHIIWVALVSWLPSKADFSKYSHFHLELSEKNVFYQPGKDKYFICAAYPDIFDQHKCEKYIFARVSSRYVPIAQIKIGGHNQRKIGMQEFFNLKENWLRAQKMTYNISICHIYHQ